MQPAGADKEVPSVEDVQAIFSNIFQSKSPPDDAPFRHSPVVDEQYIKNRNQVILPITTVDMESGRNRNRQSAPGVDRVTVGSSCKVRVELLAVLFTSVLLCGDIPQHSKINRTVLIPKSSGDLSWATNWQPLTISYVFFRLFHSIPA